MKISTRRKLKLVALILISLVILSLVYAFFIGPIFIDKALPEDKTLEPTVIQGTVLNTQTSQLVSSQDGQKITFRITDESPDQITEPNITPSQVIDSGATQSSIEAEPFGRGTWEDNNEAYNI